MSSTVQQPIKQNKGILDKMTYYFDIFIRHIKLFFCWEVTIYYYNPTCKGYPWQPWEIPVLQYIICILWTIFYVKPAIIGGEYNLHIFQVAVLVFMVIYLLIRFSIITKEHEKITECDVWVIQAVGFILLSDYLYKDIISNIIPTGTKIT